MDDTNPPTIEDRVTASEGRLSDLDAKIAGLTRALAGKADKQLPPANPEIATVVVPGTDARHLKND